MNTVGRMSIRGFVASLVVLVPLLTAAAPASGVAWPGGSAVSFADGPAALGTNVSGLAYQASGSSAPGVLWAVRNGPSVLYRLIWDGTKWTPDAANGWVAGKQLVYGDGTGVPDAEGVALSSDDPTTVYVATERNGVAGQSSISRPSILRYDVSSPAATLTATQEFGLAADLPGLAANQGPEAITWVPDDFLVSKGFLDEVSGMSYDPATFVNHGTGLFFVGVEQTGQILVYALNLTTGGFTRVATIASGLPQVMALEWDAESTRLWAVCDNNCNGGHATLDIAQSGVNAGRFVVTDAYDRPAGMANLNNEGLAIAPQAECVNGLKPVFWADDSETDTHALRGGTLSCTPPGFPPPENPGSPPLDPEPSRDTTVDGSVTVKRIQKQKGRITVKVTVVAAEALTTKVTGKIKAGKSYRLKPLTKSVEPGASITLRLRPAKAKYARAIADALADERRVKATITVELTDGMANVTSEAVSTKLARTLKR